MYYFQEGRTAYHYTPMCKDRENIQKLLKSAGAETSILDARQKSAKYYQEHPLELELPCSHKSSNSSKRNFENKDSKCIFML